MAEKKNIDKQKLEEQKAYNEYVKEVTPTHSLPKNMANCTLFVISMTSMRPGLHQSQHHHPEVKDLMLHPSIHR